MSVISFWLFCKLIFSVYSKFLSTNFGIKEDEMNKIKRLKTTATIQREMEILNKLNPKDFNAVICPLLCNPRKVIKIERKNETGQGDA
mgnify:CR=1 FL=1